MLFAFVPALFSDVQSLLFCAFLNSKYPPESICLFAAHKRIIRAFYDGLNAPQQPGSVFAYA